MIVLGIDTSGYANSVGVVDGERVLADCVFEARTDSLEKIVANIDATLHNAGLTLDDVQGIGVGLGPGSWTGIRVGVTVGKIIAYSTGRPVCGVSTLEVLAYSAISESSIICPVISTGAGKAVYAAFYRAIDGGLTRAGEYYVGDVTGLMSMVEEPTVFVGSEINSYVSLKSQAPGLKNIGIKFLGVVPKGSAAAHLATIRLEKGESDDVLSLTPLYLKESTARAFVNRYAGSSHVKG